MNNIEWKDSAVFFAAGSQRFLTSEELDKDLFAFGLYPQNYKDFQLNEIRTGDYIPASELDTEQKYNDVVEVFGLFGFEPCKSHSKYLGMVNYWKGVEIYKGEVANTNSTDGRQLTYSQIIAIGKLKRMMLELNFADNLNDFAELKGVSTTELLLSKEKPKRRNKLKQAYDILKSLDYEYDLVKQKWFKKEWVI